MDILVLLIILTLIGVVVFLIFKLNTASRGELDNKIIQNQLESFRKELLDLNARDKRETIEKLERLDQRVYTGISKSNETLSKQFSEHKTVIKNITEELTSIKETNKQVLNFSQKMENLEHILKNPKQRGILGEYFLETLLSNVLSPSQYKIQYKFSNGEIVDAAIFYNERVIPIDAKFSLEKFNKMHNSKNKDDKENLKKEFFKDVKKRIDETSKYIMESEKTTNFAFMFIPADGVYSSIIEYKVGANDNLSIDLIEYAFKKHVIIVSPISFYAYLETVLLGLKAAKMEKSVQEIIKNIDKLGKHLDSYQEFHNKVGKHLETTLNSYNKSSAELKKVDKDIYKITGDQDRKSLTLETVEK